MTTKRMNIQSFHTFVNETYFSGTDEHGEYFQMAFDSVELLEFIDIPHIMSSIHEYQNSNSKDF